MYEIMKQEHLAVASIARYDPSTLPGDDPFPRADYVTLHRATLNRATVKRRQFTGRRLIGHEHETEHKSNYC